MTHVTARWVSKDQFRHLATEANTIAPGETEAGFTVSARQSPEGELVRAADRYTVGGVPGQVGTSTDTPVGGRDLASFTRKNRALLSQPEHYIGAWHEGDRQPKAQVDLDVSQGFPRTEAGGVEARHATLTRNERAFGEVDEKADYAGTHTNPFSTRPLGDEGGVKAAIASLSTNPAAYEAVVSGNVLSGMSTWVNGRPVAKSKRA